MRPSRPRADYATLVVGFLWGAGTPPTSHFRNWLKENHPEFWEPQDWFSEDPEDIESTRAVYDLLAHLVEDGERVDVSSAWTGEEVGIA